MIISRYATEKDLKFIVGGIEEICRIEKEPCEEITRLKKKIGKAIRNSEIIIIEDTLPVAFAWIGFSKKIPYGIDYGIGQEYCWIHWSYVEKKMRRKGVGARLYNEVVKECRQRNVGYIHVDVFKVNQISRAFHSAMGFREMLSIYKKKI
jgi:GNAT superfamily N-acetyltransferase